MKSRKHIIKEGILELVKIRNQMNNSSKFYKYHSYE